MPVAGSWSSFFNCSSFSLFLGFVFADFVFLNIFTSKHLLNAGVLSYDASR